MYGEKWNSSAPKFAANLGLSPLEPMKVTTLSATSKSTPSPSTLNTVETDVKGHKSILDVPAAQFDWNSSGLINPLDGKQQTNKQKNPKKTEIDKAKTNKIIRCI